MILKADGQHNLKKLRREKTKIRLHISGNSQRKKMTSYQFKILTSWWPNSILSVENKFIKQPNRKVLGYNISDTSR
jgi:hypothetical protein